MTVSLQVMDADAVAAFLAASRPTYIAERIEAGDDEATAARIADEQLGGMFPGGVPSPGHLLFTIVDGDRPVGSLWIGPAPGAPPPSWWVWDIVIDEAERGHGFGRAAMLLAEDEARSRGGTHLGLNVFGSNVVARRLYESLGYEPTAINMRKSL